MNVSIRLEAPDDYAGVYAVNALAFETHAEANLVEVLRVEAQPYISLVADVGGEIVGHIMFSPVGLSGHGDLKIMGLGPIAVVPQKQGRGIGSALVEMGLEKCKDLGYGASVVLGHKEYYPRFGFTPSVRYGIGCAYEVPAEVFMVIELVPGYLQGAKGIIRYHPAFNNV
jgi:putative acetyltransferase